MTRQAAAVVVTLLLTGCGGGASRAVATSTIAPVTATTASKTTTTVASTVPTTTAPPAPVLFFPDPRAATDHLVDAWKAGNREDALKGAVSGAVASVFAQPGDGYLLYGCDSGEFSTSTCNYRNRATNGYVQVTAEKKAQGWIVSGARLSTDG